MDDTVEFVNTAGRKKALALQWPVTFRGREYAQIFLRRLTTKEVTDFMDQVSAAQKDNPDASIRFPIFIDESGQPVPDVVMDALDDDDTSALNKAALDFLPQRFRVTTPEPAMTPATDASIASS